MATWLATCGYAVGYMAVCMWLGGWLNVAVAGYIVRSVVGCQCSSIHGLYMLTVFRCVIDRLHACNAPVSPTHA